MYAHSCENTTMVSAQKRRIVNALKTYLNRLEMLWYHRHMP